MLQVDIAGLQVNAYTKKQFLQTLTDRLARGEKTFVTTPYSEFLYAALRDKTVLAMLNRADIAIPDGIGILLAKSFLTIPFTVNNYYLKILQAMWQMVYSGAGILLYPNSVYKTFPEKLTGADIVWDIAQLAADNNWRVYLLGARGRVPERAAEVLRKKHPRLNIVGTSNKDYQDPSIITDIQSAKPDILLVAFGPIRQEQWIVDHYEQLPAKLMIGLGGTFDYLAGETLNPPRFIRGMGLEWLYRLITQPKRFRRIVRATLGLIIALIRYKVFESLPYRPNVASIVFNKNNQVLVVRHNPADKDLRYIGGWNYQARYKDYWQLPQGGATAGEEVIDTAKRELWEEIKLRSVTLLKISERVHRYSYPNGSRPLWRNKNQYRYRGQEQRLVYFRFTGQDQEIQPDEDELNSYQWLATDQLRTIIHLERQTLVDMVLQDINDLKLLERAI